MTATDATARPTPETTTVAEPGQLDFTVSAVIPASRAAVHRAYTDPEVLVRWLGPDTFTMTVEEYDARPGGRYRYVHTAGDDAHTFHGVFHEVSPHRIVQTFEYANAPGQCSLAIVTLEEVEGGTRVTEHQVFETLEARDGHWEAGGRDFAAIGMAQLAEAAAEL